MSTINVLEVIRQGQIGGGESHLIDLIDGFGTDISPFVLSFTHGHMIEQLTAKGIPCHVIETQNAFDFRVVRAINTIIHENAIDLIHAHGSRGASNMLLPASKMHLPLVYTVHGWSFHQDQIHMIQKLRMISEKTICARSEQVICVSESNKATGVESFGLQNAIVIENGVNLSRFIPHLNREDIRKTFGFDENDFIVGFIGRITLQKDPLSFLKGVALAHQKNSRIKGLLIGNGDMKAETEAFLRKNNMNHFVWSEGFRTDVPELLNAIDVFCLPSLWEGLSVALLEAMAMACPVLVTPTDGTKEIIQDNHNGKIIDFGHPKMLAEQIMNFYEHPEQCHTYGSNARQLIQERFDSKNVSRQVEALYHQIIKAWN